MTTLYTLTSLLALADLRVDLSDTDPSAYRFSDAQLNRAIDRANERYSRENPWIRATIIPAVAKSSIYPWPAGALFIDRVEYPQGRWPKQFYPFTERKSPLLPTPSFTAYPNTSTPIATLSAGGALSPGAYQWAITYLNPNGGETLPSPLFPSPAITALNGQQAALSNLPVGPYGTTTRNIYRTKSAGATLYLVGSIPDNSTSTYSDLTADAALVTTAPITNTTQDQDQLELTIPPELWPQDTTQSLEISYAAKHHLDTDGTTIPERHWDVLFYGAVAYSIISYLPQVNDNFIYADGHLRDRVDDTASTIAWHDQGNMAMADFEKKLAIVREESNATVNSAVAHWGDKPWRYERI